MKYLFTFLIVLLQLSPVQAKVYYVDAAATGSNNGTSWTHAYQYLSSALTAAQSSATSDSIYVAKGTYYPTGVQSGANRDASFLIRQSGKLKIYGGFPKGGGVRNAVTHPTLLSGDIGTAGTQTDNSYHVVVIAGLATGADSVILDGLRIQWGRANGSNNFSFNGQNIPRNKGGGIAAFGNTNGNKLTLRNCIISGNYASDAGAGICNSATSPSLVNILLSGNYANYGGAMINGSGSHALIINCTIAGNYDNHGGGGMRNSSSNPIIANTIISGNNGGISNNSSTPLITYSLVQGLVGGGAGNLGGATNPDFVNPTAYGTVNISGDYRLSKASSIAINAGRNDSIPTGITADLDGNIRRYHNDSVDMGAYEAGGFSVYVDGTNGNDGNNGRSWATAFKTLSKPSYISQQIPGSLYQNVDSILVAKGTYYPTGLQNGTDRESTFLFIRGNLKVYGGYPTGGGARNLTTNPTILSGNIGNAGSTTDNSYHVVGIGNVNADSLVIDGFQITGGNADGSGTVTVGDVVLDRGNGGAISMITNGNNPQIAIRNCQINNNAAKFGGGLYCLVGSAPAISNCVISGNTAIYLGGGLYLSYSNASLKNVLVHSNSANSGSGIYCTTVTGDFINITLANNSGNGFYAENGAVYWKNSIVWDAVSGNGYTMQYSLTKGVNSTANNNVADPGFAAKDLFINPAGNNFSLFQCSPVLNVGSNSFVSGTSTDISGNPRIYNNGAVDLGAYEYQGNGFAASNKIFVDGLNGNDNNSGTTWASAFKTLSYALVKTQSNEICYSTIDSILVAKGTYYPTGAQNGTNRDSTFLFKRGKLKVYGGYPNGGGARNISLNPTILSGNIGNPADSTDNSYHVAVLVGINTDSLVIDGFRIQNGTANLNATYNYNGTSFDSRHGGGVSVITNNSNPKIALRNCSFIRNYSGFWGGGLFVNGKLSLDNCVFYENVGGAGGGIYTAGGTIDLNRCTFSFNSASDGGGIATVYLSTLNITNCLFTNNTAAYINSSGGGLFNYLSTVNAYNTTFANNSGGSGYKEGGVTYWKNSIIWDVISSNNYTTNNCLLKGKTSTANGNLSAAGLTAGSIFANPATNDFSLLPCSPAINAGSNALATGITTDISGNPRIYGSGTVDLGAYEYQGAPVPFNKIYVDSTNGSDENNGASWAYPFKTLSYALSKVHGSELCFSTVDSILVAKGTYYPTGVQSATNRVTSFLMNRGNLKIYGGYPTGGGTRNIAANPTILSGDIGTPNNQSDNSYHVMVMVDAIADSVVVDGFQIAYGNANTNSAYGYSGVTVEGHTGGGIFIYPGTSTAKIWIRNCQIRNNHADEQGGGIYWRGNHPSGIAHCTVSANTATSSGGGIYNYYTNNTTVSCIISANTARLGGGVYNYYAGPVMQNSVISDNSVTNSAGAGGIYDNSSNSSFRNVTIINNVGGGYYKYTGTTSWQNSIIWDSTSGGSPSTQYCLLKGQTSTANNNIPDLGYTAADIFANPAAGSYALLPCSPALNVGNNSYSTGYTTDISGNPRIYNNGAVDLGAYEYQDAVLISRVLYVDSLNGNDNNRGTGWNTALKTLSYALQISQNSTTCYGTKVDSVLVAKGTYYPTGAQNGTNRDSTFLISRGKLKIYGGYPSGGGARNIAGNPTILSGDIGTANNNADNSYHVMVVTGNITDSAVVDGFQIAYGMATNGSGTYSYTGFLIDRKYGGGIFVSPATSSAKIWLRNCLIRDNSAASGGGIFWTGVHPSGFNSCTITANTAAKGGGIYNLNSAISASNSILYGNTGTNSGGALYSFADNNSYQISFNNMTVVDNGSNGFYNYGYAYWRNSILWDDNSGSGILSSYSLRKGNNSTTSNNISATGLTAADIFANPAANDYKLRFCSPALNAGNNAYITGYTTDISGNSRIRNTTVDLGAYEKQSDLSNMATNAMLSAGSANATPLLPSCEENGWTWYADPSKADSLSFAIKWSATNNNAKSAAGVLLHATSGNTLASNGTTQAITTMKRYWNVDLHGTTLTTPVSVRFLFNAADTLEMHAAINSAVNSSGNKLVWFKTTGSLFNPNLVTFNDINGGNFIPLVPVYGIANGIPYVEFNGITSFSGGTAGIRAGSGSPLPVTLLNFTTQLSADNQHTLLSWQVAEESLRQYEVERSTDGAQTWNYLGAVPAAGSTAYQFYDAVAGVAAKGNKIFYRLRLIEHNGSVGYSKVNYVLLPAMADGIITVFPNPFKEMFTVQNPIPALNGSLVQVTDQTGRMVTRFNLNDTVSVDASQWLPGMYFLKFPNGQVIKVIRE